MRDIKFRLWDTVENKYHYSGKLDNGDIAVIHLDGRIEISDHETYRPKDFILEQYTGQIHEKREVFEGDVFQHPDGTKFYVKWDQGHCSFRANYYDDNLTSLLISQLDKNRGGAKYIGNIHEV